ncbi:hypothetical protein [Thermobispora bispora]|uniref:hypothetical protein n=1 Tax=Thermobispora bispora TaxID=2006 RepID=UPI00197E0914|nr:hypothetical protein [Thermobispora bispora]QSI49960.1 hypothetical protein CYL17_18445 [Thermobispora bispora]
MGRTSIRGDLAARLAAGPVARHVHRVAEAIARQARQNAPPAKTWITAHDERVRPSHNAAHGQTIPANLPYRLPKTVYVRKGRGSDGRAINPGGGWKLAPGHDLADKPRDPRLPVHQRINCRCTSREVPGAVAAGITASEPDVTPTRVSATVTARFPRVGESELADHGGGWFREAARTVAARYRATPAGR